MAEGQKAFINKKKGKIAESLLIDQIFKDEGVVIRKWEGEADAKGYISEIKKGDIHYIGVLDTSFRKDGYGLLSLANGERYFGVFFDDLRSKHGIYQYPDKVSEDGKKIEREFFFGIFDEGKIVDHGVYLWIREDKDKPMFNDFDSADFSCFIGDLNEKRFIKGTYITKDEDKYYVYHGSFNENNEKEGDGCFYYNSEKDELLYGKIVKNKFVDSYLAVFDEDGNLTNGLYATYDDNGKITDYKQREEIPDKKSIFDKMFDFRNKIMEVDYFGDVFKNFQNINKYIDTNVNLQSFDSPEIFPKLMNVTYDFNKIKMREDIDKILSKYE